MMFYATGALTVFGVWVFWLLVYDHPHQHPWISDQEKTRIEEAPAKDRVTFNPQLFCPRQRSQTRGEA